jgi:hypothetical protein
MTEEEVSEGKKAKTVLGQPYNSRNLLDESEGKVRIAGI